MIKNLLKTILMICAFGLHAFLSAALAAEVTDADEAWHNMGQHGRFAYEWHYFDIHSQDGNSLVIAFLGPNPFDTDLKSLFSFSGIKNHVGVLAQAVTPAGERLEVLNFTRKNNVSFSASPFRLQMNQSVLSMSKLANGLREYTIDLNGVDTYTGMKIKGQLTMTALMKGWKHQEGYVYTDGKQSPKAYHKWFATVPKAVVSGWYEITSKDGKTHFTKLNQASGYHDHNYGTIPIAETTDGWYWGRAEIGNKTVIYSKVFGKSKPAFLGDITYRKNPSSTIFFMGTEEEVLVDSHSMTLEDFGPQNKITLSNGMVVPKSYRMQVQGLNSQWYQLDVVPTKTLAVSVPYYSRQGGTISLCEAQNSVELCNCKSEVSETLISEQIDYPRYMQLVLKLPKPIK